MDGVGWDHCENPEYDNVFSKEEKGKLLHKIESELISDHLDKEFEGKKFHAIWGLSNPSPNVASLVTAYLPDPLKWTPDLKTRLKP